MCSISILSSLYRVSYSKLTSAFNSDDLYLRYRPLSFQRSYGFWLDLWLCEGLSRDWTLRKIFYLCGFEASVRLGFSLLHSSSPTCVCFSLCEIGREISLTVGAFDWRFSSFHACISQVFACIVLEGLLQFDMACPYAWHLWHWIIYSTLPSYLLVYSRLPFIFVKVIESYWGVRYY